MEWEDPECKNDPECLCPNRKISPHAPFSEDGFANDTKFHHLVHSNKYPTHPEEQIIQASVVELQSRRSALESSSQRLHELRRSYYEQISCIDAELQSQECARLLIEDAICIRRRVLAPVRRLPAEILRQIFLFTVNHIPKRNAEADGADWWSFKDPECMLWTIELVCQQWRAVVVDYPKAWSYLSLRILPSDEVSALRQSTRLAVQLDRAQLHTLSVALYPGPALNTTSTSVPGYLVHLLLPYARRITTLDLFLPYGHIYSLALLARRLSSLTHLAISNTTFAYERAVADPSSGEPATLFHHCAQLKTVSFVDVQSPVARFRLPWETIVSLSTAYPDHQRRIARTAGISPPQAYLALRATSGLQQCSLHLRMSNAPPQHLSIVTVHRLRQLELVFPEGHADALLQLLELIALPLLTSLSISTEAIYPQNRTPDYIFAATVDAIGRWKCPLQKVKYLRGNVGGDDLARLFELTNGTPTALELDDLDMLKTDVALDIDQHSYAGESLLPSILEHLSIASLTTIHVRAEELSRYLASKDVFAALVDAVQRSQCPLEELEYQHGFTEYQDVDRLIRATSGTLRSLSIVGIASEDMTILLVDALVAPKIPDVALLAPLLHTLVLTGCVHRSADYNARTFSAGAYVEMVRSRYTEAPFRTLHIGWEPESPECPLSDAVRELESMQAEMDSLGLDVSFTYSLIEEEQEEDEEEDEEDCEEDENDEDDDSEEDYEA